MATAEIATGAPRRGAAFATVATVLAATVVAAGVGVGCSLYLVEYAKSRLAEEQRKALSTRLPAAIAGAGLRMVKLEPMIVNLRAPRSTWIRLEASLLVDTSAETQSLDSLKAQAQTDVFAFVATLDLASLEGAVGLAALREDLARRARIHLGEAVRDVVINALVLQ